jgi:hypothetical protein
MIDDLLRSGDPIVVLLEAESSAGPRYASNSGYVSAHDDATAANRAYPDWLIGVPEIREELPAELFGSSTVGWSEAVLSNPAGIRDGWLDEAWDGRAVRLLVGAPSWTLAQFVPVFAGVATGLQATGEGDLRLLMSDFREQLNRPVQPTLLTTGPSANEPAPIVLGSVYNIEPPNTDAALHRYPVHDAAVTAISDVRVGGLTSSHTNDLANGHFDLGVTPAGRVTADVTGPLSTAAEMLVEVASRAGYSSFDTAGLAAFASAAPQPLGLYVGERRNAIDVLDDIAASVGAWWGIDSLQQITAAVSGIGTPVLTLTADDVVQYGVELTDVVLPAWRVRVGYRRNWAVQTDGLFAAVPEDARQRFGREYDVAEANDPAVQTLHPLARDPDVAGTLLVSPTDAAAEAARRLALFGVPRRLYRVRATRRAWPLRAGQTVTLDYSRYGLAGGVDMLILRVSRRLDSHITELTAMSLSDAYVWGFNGSAEGWVAVNATLSVGPTSITLDHAPGSGDGQLVSPASLSIAGATHFVVRARVRRIAGAGWDGTLFYVTPSHNASAFFNHRVPTDPTVINEWVVITWDMSQQAVGGTDWVDSIIDRFRIDLGTTVADAFEIDWVAIR